MRLIDADELKGKLLKMQKDIANGIVSRGNSKSDIWKAAYLLVFDEYIKMLDEMPSVINDCDADAIHTAYCKGYSKGREDILEEQQLMKDYCKNDCDTLDKIQKEKMDNSKMTRDELWSKIIQNLKILDQEAHDDEFIPLITRLLVMTAERLNTDVKHNSVKQEDKSHMWSLIDKLGNYSIKGETIRYLPEYQEIKKLVKEVF